MTPALKIAIGFIALSAAVPAAAEEVNIYTTREPGLIQPILDAYTAETGTTVNTVFLQDGLIERVKAEGESSPADILMTVDFGALIDLVDAGLTQPVESEILRSAIPESLRDPQGNWFALSGRARIVYAARDLDIDSITYEELADEKWRGRLCIRSGQHPYNTALFAAYIAHHGEEAAEEWLRGVKANQARPAAGGDRDGARDIAAGICDIAIGNSYYVGRMKSGGGGAEQVEWGDAIKVLIPTFEDGGTHVNITGASVAAHAPNREEATELLEYLVSDEAQKLYAEANFEHPITATAEPHPIVASFGEVVPDTISLGQVLPHRTVASEMVDRLNFDTFEN
ncbi:extracellular solute-binding protein [Afifella marina]|uniref:Iron(III) transport system substrate-binding protein n=1 Tax=Afifella marina DSM 2698 TaxID=1120955 RepID=A0A1G5NB73_AFIMA|nr:extracellular solute-binding protein [Afifella marina]MBK1623207.1 iron ABC transporter substrate-binding protein [Afifella marina DSM 2698]MBK1626201.1 iron ABC transporter substrate-binding protein [Afifella marina]MBK5917079.1 iron ABC transporter substrate-binding protein [Afifella marina]RAI22070.1 iron ABC transporter substrate-binding protein [Afifella marina DSM 2698]SCZ34665.1 iron(III) transport system substrate-binding protein [Afifella marina DSM 2698]